MVFESTRLRLVGVANQVAWHALGFGQKTPLHPHRKTRTAAPTHARFFYFFDNLLGGHFFNCLLNGLVATHFAVHLEGLNSRNVDVFGKYFGCHCVV